MLLASAILLASGVTCAFAGDVTFGTEGKKKTPLVWSEHGQGIWHVMKDGTLTGARDVVTAGPKKKWMPVEKDFRDWVNRQAWIFTKQDFGDCDLEFEYWLRSGGNSGVGLWDISRGAGGIGENPDYRKTTSKVAYEIQMINEYPDPKPPGSIYGVQDAVKGVQVDNEWNRMKVEARADRIRVFLNGKLVAEHETLPDRPKKGPIGLQLHDQFDAF